MRPLIVRKLRPDQLEFVCGDVLPSAAELAHFVVGICAASNDLKLVNQRIERQLKRGKRGLVYGLYDFWVACAHFREAVNFVRKSANRPDIAQFIASLPPDAQNDYAAFRTSYDPWANSFVARVVLPVRNLAFHYLEPGDPKWRAALIYLQRKNCGIDLGAGRNRDVRHSFADEVITAMATEVLGPDPNSISASLHELARHVVTFGAFSAKATTVYMHSQPQLRVRRSRRWFWQIYPWLINEWA